MLDIGCKFDSASFLTISDGIPGRNRFLFRLRVMIVSTSPSVLAQVRERYLDWEDRLERGDNVSLEQICEDQPELLPELHRIAEQIAAFPSLGPTPVPPTTDTKSNEGSDWKEIGRGASSIVYFGFDKGFGIHVAYKVLHPQNHLLSEGDFLRQMHRFEREAQILAKLKHQGIVRIYQTFLHHGRPALKMEYLPGGTLKDKFAEVRAGGSVAIARFMHRVTLAVSFAHSTKIVHRDLKPSNILLDAANQPCVSDFGVAKLLFVEVASSHPLSHSDSIEASDVPANSAEALTRHGRQPGTWEYMAPEQFDPFYGSISPATDVWALGVILYELLTGEKPFTGATREDVAAAVCDSRVTLSPGLQLDAVGRRLFNIARQCLNRDPNLRFGVPAARVRRISTMGEDPTPHTGPAGALAEAIRSAASDRSRRRFLGVGGLSLTAVLAGWFMRPKAAPSHDSPELVLTAKRNATVDIESFNQLKAGKSVVLIDRQLPPRSIAWVNGTGKSMAIQSGNGVFQIRSEEPGGGMLELLPKLPHGKYRIQAELKHESANDMSWVGIYVCAGHWTFDDHQHHAYSLLRFADQGRFAGDLVGAHEQHANRRTHFLAVYQCESSFVTQSASLNLPRTTVAAPSPGPRTVSIIVEADKATAMQGQDTIGSIGPNEINRLHKQVSSQEIRDKIRINAEGGIGLYVFSGTMSVFRLEIVPLRD
jgi:serine/threonine protein kinase